MKYIKGLTSKLFITVVYLASLMLSAQSVSAQTCCEVENTATTADDPNPLDLFATSLAMDGDTAVVGAPLNDDQVTNGGRAYVFAFSAPGSVWVQLHELQPSFPGAGAEFGNSVAIDGAIIVVGAFADDLPGAANAGSAYIFEFSGGSWSQVAKITASDAAANDFFGETVAISGNWIAVGASRKDGAANNIGAVYLFEKPAGGWDDADNEDLKLTASDATLNARFGQSVAIDGELLIVGAPGTNIDDEVNAGQAYIFRYDDPNWNEEQILTAVVPNEFDQFGLSVSISGDGALVGAPFEDSVPGVETGAAYVFRYNSATANWDDEERLIACDDDDGAEFGYSVSLDGIHAAIGARENGFMQDAGSAYTYRNLASGWADLDKFTAFAGDTFDLLGNSISLSGDKVLVGAPGWDITLNGAEGGMFSFENVQCPWDLDNNGVVGASDLLLLLANWGNPYGAADLLALLADWGACACGFTAPLTLAEELADACLSQADWDEYEDVMTDPNSSQADKDRYDCWMTHYLLHCNNCTCEHKDHCPDADPFN